MARKFKLNTAGISTLAQVLIATPSGKIYDHKAREVAGTVELLEAEERDAVEVRKHERSGIKTLTET